MKKNLQKKYIHCKSCNEKLDVARITGFCNLCALKIKKEKNIKGENLNEYY